MFSDIEWQCGEQLTDFGDSLCASRIGTFNGYPSQLLMLYFRGDSVSGLKLIYRSAYHQQLIGYLIEQLGQPDNVEAALSEGPAAAEVLEWELDRGVVVMKKKLGKSEEPALLWLARAAEA